MASASPRAAPRPRTERQVAGQHHLAGRDRHPPTVTGTAAWRLVARTGGATDLGAVSTPRDASCPRIARMPGTLSASRFGGGRADPLTNSRQKVYIGLRGLRPIGPEILWIEPIGSPHTGLSSGTRGFGMSYQQGSAVSV